VGVWAEAAGQRATDVVALAEMLAEKEEALVESASHLFEVRVRVRVVVWLWLRIRGVVKTRG
jgi:hypothetical protein